MTTSARSGHGTLIYEGGTGTPKTGGTLIEEVTDIDLPDEVDETIEATSHDSTADEYIPSGCPNSGEVTVTGNWTGATGQAAMKADKGGAATQYYINLPGGSDQKQLDFMLLVNSFKITSDRKGVLQFTAKGRITGAITWTAQG